MPWPMTAIETLSEVYVNCVGLSSTIKKYLDMIGWAKNNPKAPIFPAYECDINSDVVKTNGVKKNQPAHIHVEDVLVLGHSKSHIEMKLAVLIKAIFVVMIKPNTTVRQCPLAMDK